MTDDQLEAMLPDEVKEALAMRQMQRLEQIELIGQAVAKKRDEAVNGRASSGIEQEWQEDEDAYLGVDDANRKESKTTWTKPASLDGTPTRDARPTGTRSTAFLNITRPYTDAASARIADMLLPNDDRNWSIKPTPVPQLERLAKAATESPPAPATPAGAALPGMPGAPAQPAPQPPAPQQPQLSPVAQAVQQAVQIMADANQRAEQAEKQIEDWLIECQWHAEVRKMLEDCGRLGTGILKGPTPAKARRMKSVQGPNGELALDLLIETVPQSRRVNPWNFYPDPNCGENFQDGQYVVERDELTARQLRDLKGLPGYLDEMIDKVIEEGPGKKYASNNTQRLGDDTYDVDYFYGLLDREDLETLGVDLDGKRMDMIPAIVTLVNDTAIKAALNPLDSGAFPYDMMPWSRRNGSPWGVGIPRQIRTPQKMLNAAARNMLDNAGLAGGPILGVRRNAVTPSDNDWTLRPRKIFFINEDAEARSIADAISAINIPSMQGDLMAIIQFAMKMAEDVTGLPQLMQGQLGQAPDTVGGMNMLQNNASTVLRRIARTFDDRVTEPHIRRYYEFLMMYGKEEVKGDYSIDARGSTALVERDLANQAVLAMGQFVMNPAFELSPARWIREAIKAQRLDVKKFELTDEEKQKMAQQQPPENPTVTAAKIRADAQLKAAQISNQTAQVRIQADTDRDTAYVDAEMARAQSEHEARMSELMVKRELAMLQYANANKQTLEQVKARLAETAMKLNVQRELAGASLGADLEKHYTTPQVAKPAVEPPGRAPDGMAFQK